LVELRLSFALPLLDLGEELLASFLGQDRRLSSGRALRAATAHYYRAVEKVDMPLPDKVKLLVQLTRLILDCMAREDTEWSEQQFLREHEGCVRGTCGARRTA
jgi:hypothetical protein